LVGGWWMVVSGRSCFWFVAVVGGSDNHQPLTTNH